MRQETERAMRPVVAGLLGVGLAVVGLFGCASSTESAGAQSLSANVGRYSAPPSGVEMPRVGVPPFLTSGSGSSAQLNEIAADQATTLLVQTDRFTVIERAQLEQLKREQGLEGMVRDGEGQVRGVDYLLIGKVTNMRVKAENSKRGVGIGNVRLPFGGSVGAFDYQKKSSKIKAECGIDLRLVDPEDGTILAARSKDYTRTDSISAFGVEILGVGATADADLQIDEDNRGLLLRLAIDECLRDMMPSIDRKLRAEHSKGSDGSSN